MCGRIIIQLAKSMQEVMDIGVVVLEKEYSFNKFRFVSLLQEDTRK